MLSCGMYQSDLSDLTEDEVDWGAGTITRSRSKTGSQVVAYKLWPETFELLAEHRHQGCPCWINRDDDGSWSRVMESP